jgi:hypothetical protein
MKTQLITIQFEDGSLQQLSINKITDNKFRASTLWFNLDGTRDGDGIHVYVEPETKEIVDAPIITYKAINSAAITVGAVVYLKHRGGNTYQAGTITRKNPGLTVEVGTEKYRTNKNGWGGGGAYQVFTA